MSTQMDSELPSHQAASHSLKLQAVAPPSGETKDHALQSHCPNRHSDRILSFLRKNPSQAEWFQ
jgi:hypothetical protein